MISWEEYQRRINLPLEEKIIWSKQVITEYWAEYHEKVGGKGVYVAFSGGKDSQVLLHIVRSMFPDTPAVFADTKLEFPEIRKHVKTFDNVVWLRPVKMFKDVVKEYGYAVGSKQVSRMVSDLRHPRPENEATRNLFLTGVKRDGNKSSVYHLAKKWHPLLDAPFEVSNKCCDYFKKMPFKEYEKETGRKVISGTLAEESQFRRISYLRTGCNTFGKKSMCRPLSIWKTEDIYAYAEMHGLKFCEVYYDMILEDGSILEGEDRTGCVICGFGVEMEKNKKKGKNGKSENRFQRLARRHPKMHEFFMGEAGLREVFNYIGVPVDPELDNLNLFNYL